MKNPIIIANWKMQLNAADAVALAKKVKKASAKYKDAEVVLCPSFTELAAVAAALKGSSVALGAQDCFWEERGAYTGEVSPQVLKEYGVQYVIVGHSERRMHLGGTDSMVNRKIRMLLSLNMTPILCVGERFEERQEGRKDHVILQQLTRDLAGVWFTALNRLIVAYEPVWVIGSGQDVDPEEIEHTSRVIRQSLYDQLPDDLVDEQIKIIYGGSVDPENVRPYLGQPGIAGALVGGASLEAAAFSAIVAAALKST